MDSPESDLRVVPCLMPLSLPVRLRPFSALRSRARLLPGRPRHAGVRACHSSRCIPRIFASGDEASGAGLALDPGPRCARRGGGE